MTCEEYRVLTRRSLADITHSEGIAGTLHQRDCAACKEYARKQIETLQQQLSPEAIARCQLLITQRIAETLVAIHNDPELLPAGVHLKEGL